MCVEVLNLAQPDPALLRAVEHAKGFSVFGSVNFKQSTAFHFFPMVC